VQAGSAPAPPSFVRQVISPMGFTPELQRFLKGLVEHDDQPQDCGAIDPASVRRRPSNKGRADFGVARHLSSPCGVRQRLTAKQLIGRLSLARYDVPTPVRTWGDQTFRQQPLTRRTGEVQCLGGCLGKPGDCDQARRESNLITIACKSRCPADGGPTRDLILAADRSEAGQRRCASACRTCGHRRRRGQEECSRPR
jgi:hypothetical protein